ncbi:MAG: hypothetical protein ACT4P4_03370 [Betaproteobacteria bacterium]
MDLSTLELQWRLALRIAAESGGPPVLPEAERWSKPEWTEVAPGIGCKLRLRPHRRHAGRPGDGRLALQRKSPSLTSRVIAIYWCFSDGLGIFLIIS